MRYKVIAFVLLFLTLGGVHLVEGQQPKTAPRIGFLTASSLSVTSARLDSFRQGLRELGYVEGKNIVIEWRYAEGKQDRLNELTDELVRLKIEVIVAGGGLTIPPNVLPRADRVIR